MKESELKKKLKSADCEFLRNGGNHEIWINKKTGAEFEVWRHKSKDIPKGTAEAILKKAGLK